MNPNPPLALSTTLLVGLLVLSSTSSAQGNPSLPNRLELGWEQRYEHGLTGHDSLAALALDPSGNVFSVGSSLGFNGTYTYEIVTLKYSPVGTLLWERRYDSPGSAFNDEARDVATSPDGSVTVLGQGPGSSGDQDIVLLRYDALGNQQWAQRWSNNWSDSAVALELAADGSIYVLGQTYFVGNVTDIALLKYDPTGVLLWSRFYHGGFGTDIPVDLAVDPTGNVTLAGYSIAAGLSVNYDWVALEYDPSGNLLWSTTRGGTLGYPDYLWGFHLDVNGDVVLTGAMVNASTDFTAVKLAGTGQHLWTRTAGSGTGKVITSDASGNLYVAGGSQIVSYTASGMPRWSETFGGSATAIAIDGLGRVVVSGSTFDFVSDNQFLAMVFGRNGRLRDALGIVGGQSDAPAPRALAVGPNGALYLAGTIDNGHDQDGITLRYSMTR